MFIKMPLLKVLVLRGRNTCLVSKNLNFFLIIKKVEFSNLSAVSFSRLFVYLCIYLVAEEISGIDVKALFTNVPSGVC